MEKHISRYPLSKNFVVSLLRLVSRVLMLLSVWAEAWSQMLQVLLLPRITVALQ